MANPFIGQIKIFAGTFAPRSYAFCQGQLMAIADYPALFSLLGTTYGGDGQTTFALPDLRGRIPVGQGQGTGLSVYQLGQSGGSENVTLVVAQLPDHTHTAACNTAAGNSANPANNFWAANANTGLPQYAATPDATSMSGNVVGGTGGSQPHENRMPFLAVNFIIALEGVFPSRS